MTRAYGWRPDLPDKRDRYHAPRDVMPSTLPRKVDLSPVMPPCWDQLDLGSCTAFAIGGALAYEHALREEHFTPSFLQLYYAERELEGAVQIDGGAYIRDGAKVAAQQGMAPSSLWPYQPSRFAVKPSKQARKAALDHRVTSYARVRQRSGDLRSTLAGGDTIVFGVTVYESFEAPRNGIIPMPRPHEELLGGHAILLVGYDDDSQLFKFRNSWGTSWGEHGYAYLPYEYVLDEDLAADFWVLKEVTP